MSVKIVKGDAITALINGDIDYLIHQTNAVGGFGSGLAGQIRKRIPQAYQAYKDNYDFWINQGYHNIPLGSISTGASPQPIKLRQRRKTVHKLWCYGKRI